MSDNSSSPDVTRALPPPEQSRRRPDPVPLLLAAGIVALGIAVIWLWVRTAPEPEAMTPAVDPARVAALEAQLRRIEPLLAPLDQRIGRIEPLLTPLDRRIAAIETRPTPPATDLTPVEQRLAALNDRLAALEGRPDPTPLPLDELASRRDLAALAARQDTVASRQDSLAARQAQAENEITARITTAERALSDHLGTVERGLAARLDALESRLAASERVAARLPQLEDRAARLARLTAMREALEGGRPLGMLPDAPPELARFATQAPPTEAGLKLAFPAAARAARAASEPDSQGQGILESAWNRAQALVTVRRGEEVVVGDPAAGVLAAIRNALEAGDLSTAVAAAERLPPAAAIAFKDWTEQAKALLAARAALARLAAI